MVLGAVQDPQAFAAEGEITPEERAHWAFQPVVRPAVPEMDALVLPNAHEIAVTDLCHALLNANEFLYLE